MQKIPGTYKNEKPKNTTGIGKVHLKRECLEGSISNGVREPILCSLILDKPSGHKLYKESGDELFGNVYISVWSHITFF